MYRRSSVRDFGLNAGIWVFFCLMTAKPCLAGFAMIDSIRCDIAFLSAITFAETHWCWF